MVVINPTSGKGVGNKAMEIIKGFNLPNVHVFDMKQLSQAVQKAKALLRTSTSQHSSKNDRSYSTPKSDCPQGQNGPGDEIPYSATMHFPIRFICAGGDGTVSAVINEVHANGINDSVAIGVLPLGTGNDLARSVSTKRPRITPQGLLLFLDIMTTGVAIPMDVWKYSVVVSPGDSSSREALGAIYSLKGSKEVEHLGTSMSGVATAYISLGVDAQLVWGVELCRSWNIDLKLIYFLVGTYHVLITLVVEWYQFLALSFPFISSVLRPLLRFLKDFFRLFFKPSPLQEQVIATNEGYMPTDAITSSDQEPTATQESRRIVCQNVLSSAFFLDLDSIRFYNKQRVANLQDAGEMSSQTSQELHRDTVDINGSGEELHSKSLGWMEVHFPSTLSRHNVVHSFTANDLKSLIFMNGKSYGGGVNLWNASALAPYFATGSSGSRSFLPKPFCDLSKSNAALYMPLVLRKSYKQSVSYVYSTLATIVAYFSKGKFASSWSDQNQSDGRIECIGACSLFQISGAVGLKQDWLQGIYRLAQPSSARIVWDDNSSTSNQRSKVSSSASYTTLHTASGSNSNTQQMHLLPRNCRSYIGPSTSPALSTIVLRDSDVQYIAPTPSLQACFPESPYAPTILSPLGMYFPFCTRIS